MRTWQELIGARPHMIDPNQIEKGYTARDTYEVVDGIAVVDASGVLINDADWWDGWGYSTYDRIRGEIQGAAADPEVEGILLRVNSPGGETDNAFETADAILSAGRKKPVWAVADITALSAGYLLASSAERIWIAPKTGAVGSIGIYALHLDFSRMLDQAGVKATFIEEPEGKTGGHPFKPLSAEALSELEERVGYLSGMFFEHVAARRKLTVEGVAGMRARAFEGAGAAIEVKLADKVGTLETALVSFRGYLDARKELSQFSFSVAAASATKSPEGGSHMEVEKPKADATAAPPAAVPPAPATEAPAAPPAAYTDGEEVLALCAVAGVSAQRAQEFITQRKSAKEVSHTLLAERAANAGAETISQIQPHSGASASNPNESPVVKAMGNLAGKETK